MFIQYLPQIASNLILTLLEVQTFCGLRDISFNSTNWVDLAGIPYDDTSHMCE